MFKLVARTSNLARTTLSRYLHFNFLTETDNLFYLFLSPWFGCFRSLPAFSSSSQPDPTCRKEAPKIETEAALLQPSEAHQKKGLEGYITVPKKVMRKGYFANFHLVLPHLFASDVLLRHL